MKKTPEMSMAKAAIDKAEAGILHEKRFGERHDPARKLTGAEITHHRRVDAILTRILRAES